MKNFFTTFIYSIFILSSTLASNAVAMNDPNQTALRTLYMDIAGRLNELGALTNSDYLGISTALQNADTNNSWDTAIKLVQLRAKETRDATLESSKRFMIGTDINPFSTAFDVLFVSKINPKKINEQYINDAITKSGNKDLFIKNIWSLLSKNTGSVSVMLPQGEEKVTSLEALALALKKPGPIKLFDDARLAAFDIILRAIL